jgi:polyphosphate kinase
MNIENSVDADLARAMSEAASELDADALRASPKRFFNRELSWLGFNYRVLMEARNANHPLFERLRFLSISGNNLDEFYMVRVAGLAAQIRENVTEVSQDGLTPAEQLESVRAAAADLMGEQDKRWLALLDELKENGVELISASELTGKDRDWLDERFHEQVLLVLTPMAIDPAHPFPFMPNRGLGIALQLSRKSDGERMNALVQVPQQLERFTRLPDDDTTDGKAVARFIKIEDMIVHFAPRLFPGYKLEGRGVFRVLRDSDIEIEEEAEDLVRYFERALKRRRRGSVVRLEVDGECPEELRQFMARELGADDAGVVRCDGVVGYADTSQLILDERPELKFPAIQPALPRAHPRSRRRLFCRNPPERHHRPPPVRVVRRGCAVRTPGGEGSGRRGDQADALSHLKPEPHCRSVDHGCRSRQVGHGGGRTQGPVRRGKEHPVGPAIWSAPACRSCLASLSSKPMPRHRWWFAAKVAT